MKIRIYWDIYTCAYKQKKTSPHKHTSSIQSYKAYLQLSNGFQNTVIKLESKL